MKKLLDFIYIAFFGKYTQKGFVSENKSAIKHNYIFDSVFPDEEVMKIALASQQPQSISVTASNTK